MREFERMYKREKEEGINGESQNRGDRKCNARAGFMERKREREMEQNGKKRRKKVTCVCRSVTRLSRRVFSVIFFIFFILFFLIRYSRRILFILVRENARGADIYGIYLEGDTI